jgi:lipopolysaccharide transport system ATP-binding protein
MSDTVIKVENLSKKYIIRHQNQEKDTALRDVISNGVRSIFNAKEKNQNNREEFWALKDVSFEINQGDRVGIIGRNGAGKSTLLKILSRITEPTKGQIKIKGRVASLLEVGTGFHPELTGRENIFLNGAILGMSKVEIQRKFDEIVAFAEVEKFLDTPVKRYSSGMYVRLAFAVAAHLEPEILVVDEVLAVGDAQFQKKCLGKMEEVGKEGRTVLFVSHNLGAIKSLCSSGIVLSSGKLIYHGSVSQSISHYNDTRDKSASNIYINELESDRPYIKKIEVHQKGIENEHFQMNLPIEVNCEFEDKGVKDLALGIVVRNSMGDWIVHSSDEFAERKQNKCQRQFIIPSNLLGEGDYYMMFALGARGAGILYQKLEDIVKFHVEFAGSMADKTVGSNWKGFLAPGVIQWE